MTHLIFWLAAAVASAQTPPDADTDSDAASQDPGDGSAADDGEDDPPDRRPVAIAVRGIAETWSDPGIGTVYGTGGLLSGIGVVVPLFGALSLDVEAAYRRMYTDDGAAEPDDTFVMEVLPVSLLVAWTLSSDRSPVEGFVALGPSFAGFREHHPAGPDGLGVTRGAKLSLEPRVGLRFDTGLVQPTMAGTSPVQGVDLELYGARRLQLPGGKGFDLDAWRGGVGLAVRI